VKIARLSLHDFRNIAELSITPHDRFNVIYGDNAQGKTNLLESVYLLGTLRSFKGVTNAELVRWGSEEAMVRGVVERREVTRDIRINIRANGRTVHVDGKKPRRIQDAFGTLTVVLFAPEDLAISKGSPQNRRSFLDRAVFNVFPAYWDDLRAYETALKSRNALLRDAQGRPLAGDVLAVFDAQVAATGARVVEKRLRFLDGFTPHFSEVHGRLGRSRHTVSLGYDTEWLPQDVTERPKIEEVLAERLEQERRRDIARGVTSSGPHRDDVLMVLDGHPARSHASQGQHRTLVLALKIAEILHLSEVLSYYPVLLLDDVSSELDKHRNAELMSFLTDAGVQVFVSTTDPSHVKVTGEHASFRVEAGRVDPAGPTGAVGVPP
jgi:DNA replication and repair protein RecF